MKKRITKLLAVVLAVAMISGTSVVALAETNEELLAQYYAALASMQGNNGGTTAQASNDELLAQYYAALAKQQASGKKQNTNGKVFYATDATFDSEVTNYTGGLVLVDFYADWCGPCQSMKPILNKIAKDHPEYKIVEMDVDTNYVPDIFGVRSIPYFMIVKDGVVQESFVGSCSEKTMLNHLKKYK